MSSLSHDDWQRIDSRIAELVKQSHGPMFVQGSVIKADSKRNIIWLEEFGDQPIPMFTFDYDIKYYDSQYDDGDLGTYIAVAQSIPSGSTTLFDFSYEFGVQLLDLGIATAAKLKKSGTYHIVAFVYSNSILSDAGKIGRITLIFNEGVGSFWENPTANNVPLDTALGGVQVPVSSPWIATGDPNIIQVAFEQNSGSAHDFTCVLNITKIRTKLVPRVAHVKPVCPKVGDIVLVARQHGSRRLPKCLGVLRSTSFVIESG